MQELLALYRFALRSGDRPLAEALAGAMRSDPRLSGIADLELRRLPRGRPRRSGAADRAVAAALRRLGSTPP
jgi:hypothetical protein